MGADDDVRVFRGADETQGQLIRLLRGRRLPRTCRRTRSVLAAVAGPQGDLQAQRLQPPGENQVMLLGQHLRRGHQDRLITGLHGEQHRRDCHQRLARADIALQEPVHRPGRRQVTADFADGTPLRGREREAQRVVKTLQQLAGSAVGFSLPRDDPRAPRGDEHLEAEELRQDQVPPRGVTILLALAGKWMSRNALPRGIRSSVSGSAPGKSCQVHASQGVVDRRAQGALAQAFGGRVNGRDALEVDQALLAAFLLDDLELGMIDDDLRAPRLGLAVDDHPSGQPRRSSARSRR